MDFLEHIGSVNTGQCSPIDKFCRTGIIGSLATNLSPSSEMRCLTRKSAVCSPCHAAVKALLPGQSLAPSPEKHRRRQRQVKESLRSSWGRSQRKHAPGDGECRPKQTSEKTKDKKEESRPTTAPEPDKGQYVDICKQSTGEYKLENIQDGLKSLSIGDSRPRTISPSIEQAFESGEALTPPDIESFEDETDDYWEWDRETQQFRHWDDEDQEWVYFPEIFD
ncbi:hypothetical protein N0V84_001356 [Fusarium piperis]|uniref:Uncharacterized protein n=1 Tax=Fusarium piperis TaxID=1435070 RepID=A0A9W8WLX6_9HYPO|nr:hypothetical protein N0V84_001356 [Fusarium piperis]